MNKRAWASGVGALVLLTGLAVAPVGAPALAAWQEAPAQDEESPFKRKDVPPDGVEALLSFGSAGGGAAECAFGPGAEVVSDGETPGCTVEVADGTMLYFRGFAPEREVQLELTRPDGTLERAQARGRPGTYGFSTPVWRRTTLPGDPLGEYSIVASQGSLRGRWTFTVRAATQRQGAVVPGDGPLGTTHRIALAGFARASR